jgi:hypothetical protein
LVGKYTEALEVLKRLHFDAKDSTHSVAEAEFMQIKAQVDFDRQVKAGYIQVRSDIFILDFS